MVSYPILILVAVIAYVAGVLMGRRRPDRKVVWESRPLVANTAAAPGDALADPQLLALLQQKQLIAAIKRYRKLTGAGLKESKDAVEALQRSLSAQ